MVNIDSLKKTFEDHGISAKEFDDFLKGRLNLEVIKDLKTCWDKHTLSLYTKKTYNDFDECVRNTLNRIGLGKYSFNVICDETNNPPEIIDSQKLRVIIRFCALTYGSFYETEYTLPDAFEQLELKKHLLV